MGVYSLYCSGSVNTAPANDSQKTDSSNCRTCKKEVAVRDHHCIYIGQCVGVNNYKHFFSYLFYSYLTATTNLYNSYHQLIKTPLSFKDMYEFYSFWFKLRFLVFTLSAIWFAFFTGQLIAYQLYMILNNMTAREHKKQCKDLTYTFKSTIMALFNTKKRQEMKETFANRWMVFFRSRYEFLFCETEEGPPNTESTLKEQP